MESFTFNGVSSIDLGLIIKEMPPILRAERNIESISVSGRNGNLHIDNGTYKSINTSIICIVKDLTKIDLIKNTLIGTADLTLSTVPNRTFKATIKNQISFSKYLTYLREFPIQIELDPFSYGSLQTINCIENTGWTISGNIDTCPIIKIVGVGTISINNVSIEVLESDITIDCELMECVANNQNKNSKVILDNFPKLSPGLNHLSLGAGIQSVEIKYKERWL